MKNKPTVRLIGTNGNAFAIMSKCVRALKKSDVDQKEIDAFLQEAESGDYDHLLQTAMKYCDIE